MKKKSPPQRKAAIQSHGMNKGKQNMCVYACIKRSHGHVTDSVVHVKVWWVTEKHRYYMHINVNIIYRHWLPEG